MKKLRRFVNPHQETLGCEVNICLADTCTPQFMARCALRKAWLARRDELVKHWGKCRSAKTRRIYEEKLERMGVKIGE
jgi:hypothetical protein